MSKKKVFKNNSNCIHPEMILYWAIRGTEYRKKAVELILEIRESSAKDFVRKYEIPKEFINFDANSPWELAGDLRKLPKKYLSEPALTEKFSNEELIKYGNGEIELSFVHIPCHNVDIEGHSQTR